VRQRPRPPSHSAASIAITVKTIVTVLYERSGRVSAFIITRIQVGDYDTWRPMFEQDRPQAREKAESQRIFRSVDDPNHVFILLEFPSIADAQEAQRRLVESGVLDRFEDKHGPNVVEEADPIQL
jgi:hypothetical protein